MDQDSIAGGVGIVKASGLHRRVSIRPDDGSGVRIGLAISKGGGFCDSGSLHATRPALRSMIVSWFEIPWARSSGSSYLPPKFIRTTGCQIDRKARAKPVRPGQEIPTPLVNQPLDVGGLVDVAEILLPNRAKILDADGRAGGESWPCCLGMGMSETMPSNATLRKRDA